MLRYLNFFSASCLPNTTSSYSPASSVCSKSSTQGDLHDISSSASSSIASLLNKVTYDPRLCVALNATSDSKISFDMLKIILLLLQHQRQHENSSVDTLPIISPVCFHGHALEHQQQPGMSNQVFTCGVCRHRKPAQCRMFGCEICQFEVCFNCQRTVKEHLSTTATIQIEEMASLRVRRAVLSGMIHHRLASPQHHHHSTQAYDLRVRVGHDMAVRWADQAFLGHETMLGLIRADIALLPETTIVILCNAALSPRSKSPFKQVPMELMRILGEMLGPQASWFPVLEDKYIF